jgi:hypothetical protein
MEGLWGCSNIHRRGGGGTAPTSFGAPVARSRSRAWHGSNSQRITPSGCGTPSGPPRGHDHAGIVPFLVEIVGGPALSFGGAPNTALSQAARGYRSASGSLPRIPQQSCGCPAEGLTSKGWMLEWSIGMAGHWVSHSHVERSAGCWSRATLLTLTLILILRPARRTMLEQYRERRTERCRSRTPIDADLPIRAVSSPSIRPAPPACRRRTRRTPHTRRSLRRTACR